MITILGPTASGKTTLAANLAYRICGEIISADSRQVYRGMDIGTAKPTASELAACPHHLVDFVDPDTPFSASDYATAAMAAAADTGKAIWLHSIVQSMHGAVFLSDFA